MKSAFEIEPIIKVKQGQRWKSGIRVLGVAESFQKSDAKSVVAGVVMRGDFRIDGFGMCFPKVGGMDSTEQLIQMFNKINRSDIRAWLLGGSIISWFNIIDISKLYETTGLPVICVSYSDSEGIEKYLQEYFEDWKLRLEKIKKNGVREKITLDNGFEVFLLIAGLSYEQAQSLLNQVTVDGRIPEPIRVARSLASSLREQDRILK